MFTIISLKNLECRADRNALAESRMDGTVRFSILKKLIFVKD